MTLYADIPGERLDADTVEVLQHLRACGVALDDAVWVLP